MANPEHLEIVRQGAEAIKEWRRRNPQVGFDLRKADLSGAALAEANLRQAELASVDLTEAYVRRIDLNGVDLSRAHLNLADLGEADLNRADLNGADLSFVNLKGTNLYGANLREANLWGAELRGTWLEEADFTNAILSGTIFADIDLSSVKGLETVQHWGPSYISVDTLYRSGGKITEAFLRGCGIPQEFIDYLPSLIGTRQAIQFYSCFISHAATKKDGDFAERLYTDLIAKNVRCFHFRYDLKMGERWATQIDAAIKKHDKLIVVCSKEGILREGVIKEVIRAIEQETKTGVQKLFPVRLDNFILSREMDEAFAALSPHLRRADWLDYLREYQIGDFRKWKNHDAYQAEFARLLAALRAAEAKVAG